MISESKVRELAENLLKKVQAKAAEDQAMFKGVAEGINLLYSEIESTVNNEDSKPRGKKKTKASS